VTVRAKCGVVNSVFLVQLRKNAADDSRAFFVGQENCLSIRAMRRCELFCLCGARGENLLTRRGGLSTGCAQEMQKQFSVLSSQFSVLSSQFSVGMPRMISALLEIMALVTTFTLSIRLQELPERKLGAPGREFLSARQISLRGGVHDHRSGMWNQSGREQSCGTDGIQRQDVQLLLGGLQEKIRPESGAVRAASCVKIRLQKKGPCFSQGPHLFWPVR
jgi:hypothetical protein